MEIVGDYGKFLVIGGASRYEMTTEVARILFRNVGLMYRDLFSDALGIYSHATVGKYGRAKMTSLTVPRHLLQSRKNCMTWNPKGQMYAKTQDFGTHPVVFEGTQCTDFVADCFNYIFGVGNQVIDFTATEEGRALYDRMVENIFLGLGNSFHDLIANGMHPVISASNENGWWDMDVQTEEDWANYIDQQLNIGLKGHLTIVDEIQAKGVPSFNVRIDKSDIDVTNKQYKGDIIELFNRSNHAGHTHLKLALKQRRSNVRVFKLVHPMFFHAYEQYLINTYENIPDSYRYFVTGVDENISPMDGVLRWKGQYVVCMDEWEIADAMIGVLTPRIITMVGGNFCVATDVEELSQYGGMGMILERSPLLSQKGRIDMYTTFRAGAEIVSTDLMTNGSITLVPEV